MNFAVYIKKELAEQVNKLNKALNKSRNSIINEALKLWIKKHESRAWPENFFDFEPATDVSDFRSLRKDLMLPMLHN